MRALLRCSVVLALSCAPGIAWADAGPLDASDARAPRHDEGGPASDSGNVDGRAIAVGSGGTGAFDAAAVDASEGGPRDSGPKGPVVFGAGGASGSDAAADAGDGGPHGLRQYFVPGGKTGHSSGCGCIVTGAAPPSPPIIGVALSVLGLALRRRHRDRRRAS